MNRIYFTVLLACLAVFTQQSTTFVNLAKSRESLKKMIKPFLAKSMADVGFYQWHEATLKDAWASTELNIILDDFFKCLGEDTGTKPDRYTCLDKLSLSLTRPITTEEMATIQEFLSKMTPITTTQITDACKNNCTGKFNDQTSDLFPQCSEGCVTQEKEDFMKPTSEKAEADCHRVYPEDLNGLHLRLKCMQKATYTHCIELAKNTDASLQAYSCSGEDDDIT